MWPRSLVPSSVPRLGPTPSAGRRWRGRGLLAPWAVPCPFLSLTLMDPWKGGISNGQRALRQLGRDPRHSGFGLLGVGAPQAPSQ